MLHAVIEGLLPDSIESELKVGVQAAKIWAFDGLHVEIAHDFRPTPHLIQEPFEPRFEPEVVKRGWAEARADGWQGENDVLGVLPPRLPAQALAVFGQLPGQAKRPLQRTA